MKKLIALVLALACLMTLAHCRNAPQNSSGTGKSENLTVEQMEEKFGTKVVRVLMDLPNAEAGAKSGQFIDALASLPGYGTEFTVFLEYMPDEGVDDLAVSDIDSHMARIADNISRLGVGVIYRCPR